MTIDRWSRWNIFSLTQNHKLRSRGLPDFKAKRDFETGSDYLVDTQLQVLVPLLRQTRTVWLCIAVRSVTINACLAFKRFPRLR